MHGIDLLSGIQILSVADGAVVDTANFEGVLFVSPAGGTGQFRQGAADDGSDQANVASATGVVDAGGAMSVHKPRNSLGRYASVTGLGTTVAILYGSRDVERTQTLASLSYVSPA